MSREEQFDFYWKEIFDGLAYNPIEFNVYRFDQSMSLPSKFNKLYEMFKVLALNNQEVMDYLKEFVETFDFKLETTVKDVLQVWLDDGLLAEVVREAINEEVVEAREGYDNLKDRLDTEYNEVNSQIQKTNSLLESKELIIDGKSLFMDGVNDDSIVINQVLTQAKELGVSVHLPSGQITLKKPIIVEGSGVSLKTASAYKTRIVAHPDFVGEQLILIKQGSERVAKGMGIPQGIYVDCKGVNAHGIVVINAYDQHIMMNCEVRNVHLDKNAYRYITDTTIGLNVSQTILFENCIGEHIEGVATSPVYYFERVQEMTLVGTKAFINKANSTVLTGGTGYHFKDCRGITMMGCSSAFGKDAIVWESATRPSNGLTVIGQTNERISGKALRVIKGVHNVGYLNIQPIRSESGSGDFELSGITLSVIHALGAFVTIEGSQNTIYSTAVENVTGSLKWNTIIGTAKYNDGGLKTNEALTISANEFPYFDFKTTDGKTLRIRQNANATTTDKGFQLLKKIDGTFKVILELDEESLVIKDVDGSTTLQTFGGSLGANATSLSVRRRSDADTVVSRVSVGAPDSGGEGKRMLTVPN